MYTNFVWIWAFVDRFRNWWFKLNTDHTNVNIGLAEQCRMLLQRFFSLQYKVVHIWELWETIWYALHLANTERS